MRRWTAKSQLCYRKHMRRINHSFTHSKLRPSTSIHLCTQTSISCSKWRLIDYSFVRLDQEVKFHSTNLHLLTHQNIPVTIQPPIIQSPKLLAAPPIIPIFRPLFSQASPKHLRHQPTQTLHFAGLTSPPHTASRLAPDASPFPFPLHPSPLSNPSASPPQELCAHT